VPKCEIFDPFIGNSREERIYRNDIIEILNEAKALGPIEYELRYNDIRDIIRGIFPSLKDDFNVLFIFDCVEPNCQKKIYRNRGRVCNGQCYYDFNYEPKPKLKLGPDCRKTGLCCLSNGECAANISQLDCALFARNENVEDWTWYEYTNEDPAPEGKVINGTNCNDQDAPCGACTDFCFDDFSINGTTNEQLGNHLNSFYTNTRQANIPSFPLGLEAYGIRWKDGALDEFNGCSYFFWQESVTNWKLVEIVPGNPQPCRVGKSRMRVFQINCSTFELQDITQQIIEPTEGSFWKADFTGESCDFPLLFPSDCQSNGGCDAELPDFPPDPTISPLQGP